MSASPRGRESTESRLERLRRRLRQAIGRDSRPESTDPTESIDRAPARTSATLATALSILAALTMPEPTVRLLGLPGVLLLAGGAFAGSRRAVGSGFCVLVLGLLVAGFQGLAPLALLLGAVCATVAWDVGRYGVTVGEQLGRAAGTTRIELGHAVASAAVGLAAVGLGYGAALVGPGDRPVTAVALALLGAVVLLSSMRT
ncbi:DUF7519 family protein [Halovivax limisalsi]|uniref:DUF7519 family protein n=1 Tax=Halovivax limisalsi TaxID=1453760 RepID=UPI001FFD4E2B|nr:hypothetical protein [Halovivax limisalsi]